MLYSKSSNSFYVRELHGDAIPSDAVEVSKQQHKEIIEGHYAGKTISADSDGFPILIDAPKLSNEQRVRYLEMQVQQILDAKAREYGYDSILSAVSYATLGEGEPFQVEGKAFNTWRALCWQAFYNTINAFDFNGSDESVISKLPTYSPPAVD